jgi:hypothetical protein
MTDHKHTFDSDGGGCRICGKSVTELLIEDRNMKNTITTNSQATINYLVAASRIVNLMDGLGFTSNERHDPEFIRHTVAEIIRDSIEGNVNRGYGVTDFDEEDYNTFFEPPEGGGDCSCCADNDELGEIIWEIEKEHGPCDCQCDRA